MTDHELEHLLSGFAADTLTPEERKRLYSVALQNQQLFTALADEQALKQLLAEPEVRRRLFQVLQQPAPARTGEAVPWWTRFRKPAGLAWVGGLAAAILAITFGTRVSQESLDRAAQTVVKEETRPGSGAPPPPHAPTGFSAAGAPAPKGSARALFYGGESGGTGPQAKPWGLRYSFVAIDADGRAEELTAAMAARSREPVRITVEATQESYVQLLQNLGSAGTRLWWPPQETGKISLKLQARTRSEIPMPPPAENGRITLIIRLSSKPFGPLTMQEVGMLDRFSANLLTETVSPGMTAGTQEQATYVVSQDPSTSAQLAVEIPVVQ